MNYGGIKKCTQFDIDRILQHIPLDYRQYLTLTSTNNTVETSIGPGCGAYQGYEVLRINYEFNKEEDQEDLHTKIFPIITSMYSDVLQQLVQVSVIIHYNATVYKSVHKTATSHI
jgi:hypothetical protein